MDSAYRPAPLQPGLLVLQGQRLEDLLAVVRDFLAAHPLSPLEDEAWLVQSAGIAEWLKMNLAMAQGVCAATRVELPARFLWRCYRAMLGREGAPPRSPLDEGPLAWRLMRLLPALAAAPGGEPLARFLDGPPDEAGPGPAAPDLARRLQLAMRLADLFDQYQVYRADWLEDWAAGRDRLRNPATGQDEPLPAEQGWQAGLWRAVLADLDASAEGGRDPRAGTRPAVHRRFLAALADGEAPLRPLPRRVVLFGMSHLPGQMLDALAALAGRAQVILAVPNPCRYHWADAIEGRELLRAARRRHPLRPGRDPATLPLAEAHAQAHPLLAAWGRQSRDFLRLLDALEERLASPADERLRRDLPRIDLYDEGDDAPGTPLLQRVQARIRDGVPLAEHAALDTVPVDARRDRSITFHVCHGPLRELEVLHDRLLQRLADAQGSLAPRDIVVMLPDIEAAAPLIHAVFGQHPAGDARHIPYEIADLRPRGRHPLLLALEWLLRIDERRCTAGELRELIEVPALARRFGLGEDDRPLLARWLAGAGVRWGLDAAHRASLDLADCGEANTWAFGLRRLLAGYAVGDLSRDLSPDVLGGPEPWAGIEPYPEVAGLAAAAAGALARLVEGLAGWWRLSREPAPPAAWAERARALLAASFRAGDDTERALLAALEDGLSAWLADAAEAGFEVPLPLAVFREAWLARVAEPGLRQRFLAGGVTFCTLMPMRAIPFELVALLGLNEGDYPRRAPRSDFDLMAEPGQRRPGDRARRDDDRLLMLEALLSARRALIVSWSGRSPRDQSLQPPSVLVGQLRDYLAAAWGEPLLRALTTEHPLQPFSRRLFEAGGAGEGDQSEGGDGPDRPFTWAREWRALHAVPVDPAPASPRPAPPPDAEPPLTLDRLLAFLRHPVADHFAQRLGVRFDAGSDPLPSDDEPLGLDALEVSIALRELVEQAEREALHEGALARLYAAAAAPDDGADADAAPPVPTQLSPLALRLHRGAARLQREGRLPLAGLGERWREEFVARGLPLAKALLQLHAAAPQRADPVEVRLSVAVPGAAPVVVHTWLDGLRRDADGGLRLHELQVARLARPQTDKQRNAGEALRARPRPLQRAWLTLLLARAAGVEIGGTVLGNDARVELQPPSAELAETALAALLAQWRCSQAAPLRIAPRSALRAMQAMLDDARSPSVDGVAPGAWTAEVFDTVVQTYDGSGWRGGGQPPEREEAPLARLWPDAEALLPDEAAAAAFSASADALYGPLAAWAQGLTVTALPRAAAGDDADDDGEDGA